MSTESFKALLKRALNSPYAETDIGLSLFRTCLETMHARYMEDYELKGPSLELGVGDGSSSMFINGEKSGAISVGLDMPLGMTFETKGLWWHPVATHYRSYVGGNMENIPFADAAFETVYSSETMFYGMDLRATATEISRVLKPGGKFYCFNATEQWFNFDAVLSQLKFNIPSFSVPTDDEFVSIFESTGLTCERRSYFFSPAMEILLHSVVDTGAGRVAEHSLLNRAPHELARKIEVLSELLEHEYDSSSGGFHHFLVFAQTGDAKENKTKGTDVLGFDPFDHLKCPVCTGTRFDLEESDVKCSGCDATYGVVCGVPMLVDEKQSGFSSIDLDASVTAPINRHLGYAQKTAGAIFNKFSDTVTQMLEQADGNALDLVVMAEQEIESKVLISRQTASALRYLLKRAHPNHGVSMRILKDPKESQPMLEPSGVPTLALYFSGGTALPESFRDALQVRTVHAVHRVSLDIVK